MAGSWCLPQRYSSMAKAKAKLPTLPKVVNKKASGRKRLASGATRGAVRKDVVDAALGKAKAPKLSPNDPIDARAAKGKGKTKKAPAAERKITQAAQKAADDARVERMLKQSICIKCERKLAKMKFRQLRSRPAAYDAVCLACRAKEDAEDLQAQVFERAAQRKVTPRDVRKTITSERRSRLKHNDLVGRERISKSVKKTKNELKMDEAAKRELARRELLRRKLLYFVHAFHPEYQAGWGHADICARLERFYRGIKEGANPRLILCMPPRHGKSSIASKLFPAWVFGQDPHMNIIASSYGLTLPVDFSRYVRARMSEDLYINTFPESQLDSKKTNVENWGLQAGGEYIAAGVGTGISGRGADILVIDDPIKDAADADSETIRRSTLDWYKSTAYTRLSPTGGVLVILTRWHDADLAGALIQEEKELVADANSYFEAEMDALMEQYRDYSKIPKAKVNTLEAEKEELLQYIDRWEVVSYAAIAEHDEWRKPDGTIVAKKAYQAQLLRKEGDALHEDRWPKSRLMRIYNGYKRRNMRHWHALYQQKPVPDEGIFFTKDMFHYREPLASYVWREWTILQAWDLAIGLQNQHNYTVGITGALDPDDTLWILNVVRGRWDIDGIASQVLDLYARYRPSKIGVERGPLELALMPAIKRSLKARNQKLKSGEVKLTPYFLQGKDALTPINDKTMRAQPLQALMQQGAVVWPKGTPWMDNVMHEMVRFPSGVLDDCVDAAAWLARVSVATPAPKVVVHGDAWRNRKDKSWRERVRQLARTQGAVNNFMGA